MSHARGSGNPFTASIALVLGVARRKRFRVALIGGFALPFHGVQRTTGDVDFLAEASGADALHEELVAEGARCLHRSPDAANYAPGTSRLSSTDFIYARRERAREMLRRARPALLRGARLRVPVVDAEGLIGLKLPALVNAPSRTQDEADIRALLAARRGTLKLDVIRDYYRLFGRERDLERLLAETRKRQGELLKSPAAPIVGRAVRGQTTFRRPKRVRDLDEFLEFLERVDSVFGPVKPKRDVTRGDHFRL